MAGNYLAFGANRRLSEMQAAQSYSGEADAGKLVALDSGGRIASALLAPVLAGLSAVTPAADQLIYATGADTFSTCNLTAAGRNLIGAVDQAAQRAALGLGTMATQSGSWASPGAIGETTPGTGRFTTLGLGVAPLDYIKTLMGGISNTSGTTAVGSYTNYVIQSNVTAGAYGHSTSLSTAAASFVLPALSHYNAAQGTFGAGSTVNYQYGFIANSSLIGATHNFGFYGNIPAGTGRWNAYMGGSANNAFVGPTRFGGTSVPTAAVDVTGDVLATGFIRSSGSGIGYATGAGGTVTQPISRSYNVTLNKPCGSVTLFTAAGSTTWGSFAVQSSCVEVGDTVIVNQESGANYYLTNVIDVGNGFFRIAFATTGGTTVDAPVFNFSVIKSSRT